MQYSWYFLKCLTWTGIKHCTSRKKEQKNRKGEDNAIWPVKIQISIQRPNYPAKKSQRKNQANSGKTAGFNFTIMVLFKAFLFSRQPKHFIIQHSIFKIGEQRAHQADWTQQVKLQNRERLTLWGFWIGSKLTKVSSIYSVIWWVACKGKVKIWWPNKKIMKQAKSPMLSLIHMKLKNIFFKW